MVTIKHKPPQKGHRSISNIEVNACGIHDSSYLHNYNMQHPIQKDTYIILVAKYLGESVQPKTGYGEPIFK